MVLGFTQMLERRFFERGEKERGAIFCMAGEA
jgi:hypothetical protein